MSSQSSHSAASGSAYAPENFSNSRTQEIHLIENRIGEFVAAWNKHDPAQMASIWAKNGDLINPFGRLAKGRDQVQQLFRDEHAGPMKFATHQMTIDSVGWAADDVAVVDADCAVMGMRGADGKELPMFKPHVIFVMGKREGAWQILAARPYAFMPMPGAAN